MAGTRNPFGRRPHPGSRIHLRKGHGRPACFPIQKTVAKRNLGNAARKATLAANDNRREISRVSRLPANSGGVLTKTPPTEAPNHRLRPPAPPFLPPSGPANGSFNGHHPKSKLLAAKVSHEHIYWNQASVLVQLGLLDASRLPVAGRESAAKVRDASLPSNQLIQRATPFKPHSQQK